MKIMIQYKRYSILGVDEMDKSHICECTIIHEDLVEKNKKEMLPHELISNVAEFFKIFSDPTRLKIVTILLKDELCVCDIATILNMSHSSISHQLRVLRQFKIVKNRKEGKVVYYSLDDGHITNIVSQSIEHYRHKHE